MATTPVKKVLSDAKLSVIQPLLYKSVVTIYRVFAIVTLYRGAHRRARVRLS